MWPSTPILLASTSLVQHPDSGWASPMLFFWHQTWLWLSYVSSCGRKRLREKLWCWSLPLTWMFAGFWASSIPAWRGQDPLQACERMNVCAATPRVYALPWRSIVLVLVFVILSSERNRSISSEFQGWDRFYFLSGNTTKRKNKTTSDN